MAAGELSITAANIAFDATSPTSVALNKRGQVGEAVTEIMPVYFDSASTNKYKKATNATSAESQVTHLTYDAGSTDDYVALFNGGQLNIGATLVAGTTYYLSDTAGKIVPLTGLASGDYVVRIGYAISTSIFVVDIKVYGTQRA